MKNNFVEQLNDFLPYGVILVSENHEIIYQNKKVQRIIEFKKMIKVDGKLFDKLSKFPDLYLFVEDSFKIRKVSRENFIYRRKVLFKLTVFS